MGFHFLLSLNLLICSTSSAFTFSSIKSFDLNNVLERNYRDSIYRPGDVFTKLNALERDETDSSRRLFFSKSTEAIVFSTFSSLSIVQNSMAEEKDLTSQLFNPDGSLKEGTSISTKATSRTVALAFPDSEGEASEPFIFTDGKSPKKGDEMEATRKGSYQTPSKWTDDSSYIDTTEGINLPACNSIIAYQTPTKTSSSVLEKATKVGVAKALETQSSEKFNLLKADLVAGKKVDKDGVIYWDFDLAVAPLTCEGERKKEDLGLGFCPYDYIGKFKEFFSFIEIRGVELV